MLAVAFAAGAQLPASAVPAGRQSGVNQYFYTQNAAGPKGAAYQVNYPYPGQCVAATDAQTKGLFPLLGACPQTTTIPLQGDSFACQSGPGKLEYGGAFTNIPNQSAGDWAGCGAPFGFNLLKPLLPNSVQLTNPTPKFQHALLNPPDYTPGTNAAYGGADADYYEIGLHEAWGFDTLASLGLFPRPAAGPTVPNGMQWTGLICNNNGNAAAVPPVPSGCTCPAGLSTTPTLAYPNGFQAAYCSAGGRVPVGRPLLTPIWGIGQINGPLTGPNAFFPGKPSPWSANNYFATWPSITIRAQRWRPVVVKWVNEFPNTHVFCPHPEAADWPCAVDRTFMGVKSKVDPAVAESQLTNVWAEGVNAFGSPQQPDNSWVTHYHGAETPPSTDGFAEKWFGNAVTAAKYNDPARGRLVVPPFESPLPESLRRPASNFDIYTYPMVNEEATIWFHDHTLGKTHHNVIAGPAGFFPVKDLVQHGSVGTINGAPVTTVPCPLGLKGTCTNSCPAGSKTPCSQAYTWLDPVTEPRTTLAGPPTIPVSVTAPTYDIFMAIQDRSFNDDGSINFSSGLGQPVPVAPPPPLGASPVTNGVNPQVHPTWVPEYFGDHVVVNGVIWPRYSVVPGWYRLRLVDGSDSRCWTIGFKAAGPAALAPAPGTKPSPNVPFFIIANDQGYMQAPVPVTQFTMCPGERYELLVNFGALPGIALGGPAQVWMTNTAPAPFPAGITPYANRSPFAEMNLVMKFDVAANAAVPPITTCAATPFAWDATLGGNANIAAGRTCIPNPATPALVTDPYYASIRPVQPFPAGTVVRQVYLNERIDGVTLAPMGMQLNGVPFEYKVTETPMANTREVWQFVNLTVDAHPMHPHLVKHQIVSRQAFSVGQYKALLCGSTTCQPGTAPGGEMQVVPDVTPLLTGAPTPVLPGSFEGGWKDATQAPPGMVTTIVADWGGRWKTAAAPSAPACSVVAGAWTCSGGTPSNTNCPTQVWNPGANTYDFVYGCLSTFTFEEATKGPYVWHCHINSHEDSEMMRTSLVVPEPAPGHPVQ